MVRFIKFMSLFEAIDKLSDGGVRIWIVLRKRVFEAILFDEILLNEGECFIGCIRIVKFGDFIKKGNTKGLNIDRVNGFEFLLKLFVLNLGIGHWFEKWKFNWVVFYIFFSILSQV